MRAASIITSLVGLLTVTTATASAPVSGGSLNGQFRHTQKAASVYLDSKASVGLVYNRDCRLLGRTVPKNHRIVRVMVDAVVGRCGGKQPVVVGRDALIIVRVGGNRRVPTVRITSKHPDLRRMFGGVMRGELRPTRGPAPRPAATPNGGFKRPGKGQTASFNADTRMATFSTDECFVSGHVSGRRGKFTFTVKESGGDCEFVGTLRAHKTTMNVRAVRDPDTGRYETLSVTTSHKPLRRVFGGRWNFTGEDRIRCPPPPGMNMLRPRRPGVPGLRPNPLKQGVQGKGRR